LYSYNEASRSCSTSSTALTGSRDDCVLSYSSSHGYSLLAKQVGLTISSLTARASAAAKRAQRAKRSTGSAG
jgi:hypothetical protein